MTTTETTTMMIEGKFQHIIGVHESRGICWFEFAISPDGTLGILIYPFNWQDCYYGRIIVKNFSRWFAQRYRTPLANSNFTQFKKNIISFQSIVRGYITRSKSLCACHAFNMDCVLCDFCGVCTYSSEACHGLCQPDVCDHDCPCVECEKCYTCYYSCPCNLLQDYYDMLDEQEEVSEDEEDDFR